MCALDFNVSLVFESSLYLSHTCTHSPQWCWLGHWHSQEVMWCLQQSSVFSVNPPVEVGRSSQGESDRWPDNSKCLSASPGDAAAAWIVYVNPQITINSSAHYCGGLFSFLNAQSSDAFRHICIRQCHIYSFVSNVLNNTFKRQRKIKETTVSVSFLSIFFCCRFYFSYRWHCILHVFTLSCPSQKGEIILTHWHSLHLPFN